MSLLMVLALLLLFSIWAGFFDSGSKGGIRVMSPQIVMIVMFSVFTSVLQLLGQLRVLRMLPLQTSTLTHWLLFWPISIAMMMGFLALMICSLLDGAPLNWHLLRSSMTGAVFLELALPVALRYGLRPWTILPVVMFAAMGSVLVSALFGWILEIHWLWLLAGTGTFLAVIWWSTYRLLGTPHPWRGDAMRWQAVTRRI